MPEEKRRKEPLAAVLQDEVQRTEEHMDRMQEPLSQRAEAQRRELGNKRDVLMEGIYALERDAEDGSRGR